MNRFARRRATFGMGRWSTPEMAGLESYARGWNLMRAPKHGINAADDVRHTTDGVDLNEIFRRWRDAVAAVNAGKQATQAFLTTVVSEPTLTTLQGPEVGLMQKATEFGRPIPSRFEPVYVTQGVPFDWFDCSQEFSWRYLADQSSEKLAADASAAIAQYGNTLDYLMWRALYLNTNRTTTIRGTSYDVKAFWNADGQVPPPYLTNTFDGTHNHYLFSGAGTVDAGDLDQIIDDFASHGYDRSNGYEAVIMVHPTEGNLIRNFASTLNSGTGRYDFIPAQGEPGRIINTTQQMIGQTAVANTLRGLPVVGTYGPLTVVETPAVVEHYMVAFVTGGRDSLNNPLAMRQHPSIKGLTLVKGSAPDYPIINSTWTAGMGFAPLQRGQAIVMRIHASAYAVPTAYSTDL